MPQNLPLIPAVPFADGDPFTPAMAFLSMYTPIFDDQPQYLGHRERITDAELSNAPSDIKQRVGLIESGLKCTAATGLVVQYTTGVVRLPGGDLVSVPAGQLAAPDNSISFMYVAASGAVMVGPIAPTIRVLLARVTASAGAVTQVVDLRHPSVLPVQPLAASIKSFGGTSTTDYTAANGDVLDQGIYYYRNFTVPAGVTITVQRMAKILCSGNVSILGTINVTPMTLGASAGGGSVKASTTTQAGPGQGLGGTGAGYPWGAQAYGSGGGGGVVFSDVDSWGGTPPGGGGGGTLWIEAAGKVFVSGTIGAKGQNGAQGGTAAGVVSGQYVPLYGQGSFRALVSGTSGGSGGLVMLSSLDNVTVAPSATVDVRGGNGGDAFASPATGWSQVVGGGIGGTGGYIVCMAPTVNTSGSTLLLSYGSFGLGAGGTRIGTTFVWRGTSVIAPSPGGAFATNSGYWSSTSVGGGNFDFSAVDSGSGQLILRTFSPVG